ncbi:Sulfide dehydrogenase [flavocytochrome C] flavoprotein chain precursor [hydrothermal vent metagenome]|uniref:Sulfide dehydrogenase [flavocytochrome C] flavoprotein chain n=1 Tax=hydrothermal vent metagenome TaxID=652676 RepID=A0A1W1BRJ3_9ZZZZ
MNMNRRDALKISAISIAAATTMGLSACNSSEAKTSTVSAKGTKLKKYQVVIIGGGFGGLTVAKNIKKKNPSIEVLIIEKNDFFMACPFSNTYLGKLEGINLGTFIRDYNEPTRNYGYDMLKAVVTDINRKEKFVQTTQGSIKYDTLVLSPGIAYDYESTIPGISTDKIQELRALAPGALIPGSEHVTLERNLSNMEDGNVIITVPSGKFRCPPAPFERACMIAAYMKKEDIRGKVIILNPSNKVAKGAAFKEAWKELYGDIIVHMEFAKITDVDTKSKTISISQTTKDELDDKKVVKQTLSYQVLNLIPNNKANPVIEMSGVETSKDNFGKVIMNGCSFRTKSDASIYAVGDVVGHAIPPSGQTAIWSAKQCADEIVSGFAGKIYTLAVKSKTQKASNVCFSMVGDRPEEAIRVYHDFSWNGKVIKGKGRVPKGRNGKFRDTGTAQATRDWFRGSMNDLFA